MDTISKEGTRPQRAVYTASALENKIQARGKTYHPPDSCETNVCSHCNVATVVLISTKLGINVMEFITS